MQRKATKMTRQLDYISCEKKLNNYICLFYLHITKSTIGSQKFTDIIRVKAFII